MPKGKVMKLPRLSDDVIVLGTPYDARTNTFFGINCFKPITSSWYHQESSTKKVVSN